MKEVVVLDEPLAALLVGYVGEPRDPLQVVLTRCTGSGQYQD